MSKKKQKKHGFILKMFPGNKKQKERLAILLTVLMFAISIGLLVNSGEFSTENKAEAFAERVANTRAK